MFLKCKTGGDFFDLNGSFLQLSLFLTFAAISAWHVDRGTTVSKLSLIDLIWQVKPNAMLRSNNYQFPFLVCSALESINNGGQFSKLGSFKRKCLTWEGIPSAIYINSFLLGKHWIRGTFCEQKGPFFVPCKILGVAKSPQYPPVRTSLVLYRTVMHCSTANFGKHTNRKIFFTIHYDCKNEKSPMKSITMVQYLRNWCFVVLGSTPCIYLASVCRSL